MTFKRHSKIGVSPHLQLVEKAKTLLWNTSKSISEIAFDLGFEYPSHFSKVFKNRTGISPLEFRQSLN
ncbi:helix-turn-helix domain-containing protein [Arachidicoccus soli]|uniref:helix-turn-helix domain-containing protein n=1 Tax=Arachidicoccus soli TaxID=2341117 RepID=UPI002936E3FA|nr:helix-turn-helix domain-containing protein [Arachidicoccus soli]